VGVTRTWIFPILRIVIFLAIASALVKMAFFSEATSAADTPEFPTGAISEPEVAVTVATIQNDVTVQGTIVADPALPVKATLNGEVSKTLVGVGTPVAADTAILTIRSETPGAVRDDGTVAPNKIATVTVLAGSPGILSALSVIAGQTVAVGEAVGQVAPTSFAVSGTLAPDQQYRLLTRPTEAQVTITGGPAPFTCTQLTITSALAGADPAADPNGGTPESGATVRCGVPGEVTVFAGLGAELTLAGGVAENVLTVPVTSVEGSAGAGSVYVRADDGPSEKTAVVIGLNDGVNVEIKEGLAEGDLVLQFIPGAPQVGVDMGDGCMSFPDGSVTCGP
jgi:hypothetical protein